jgi:hypothetical protein
MVGSVKSTNRLLIAVFEYSKLLYLFVVFPIYQISVFVLFSCGILAFEVASSAPLAAVSVAIVSLFLGILIFSSWYLSYILMASIYFGFFAWLGFPGMAWVVRQLQEPIDWFSRKCR